MDLMHHQLPWILKTPPTSPDKYDISLKIAIFLHFYTIPLGKGYNLIVHSILLFSNSYNFANKPQAKQRTKWKIRIKEEKDEPQGEEEGGKDIWATPLYQPQQSLVVALQATLCISSGRFRFREPGLMELSESRPIFVSLHASESSLMYSRQRLGIKQTSSFFDDI